MFTLRFDLVEEEVGRQSGEDDDRQGGRSARVLLAPC